MRTQESHHYRGVPLSRRISPKGFVDGIMSESEFDAGAMTARCGEMDLVE